MGKTVKDLSDSELLGQYRFRWSDFLLGDELKNEILSRMARGAEGGKAEVFGLTQQERHLEVLKKVYRKFRMQDARVGYEEVLDRVWDEICNDMGPDLAVDWADRMKKKIEGGNHE